MSEIQMHHVVGSSNVAQIGYDAGTRTLAVQFHDGGVYHYQGVPPEKYEAFKAAKSKGKFLHAHIRGAHKAVKR